MCIIVLKYNENTKKNARPGCTVVVDLSNYSKISGGFVIRLESNHVYQDSAAGTLVLRIGNVSAF